MSKNIQYIAYVRVSTDKQGQSGLGLEAQQEAVKRHVAQKGYIVQEYLEVESGTLETRPQLQAALVHAKRLGAVLLIAKLDRLARNVHFISGLLRSGVEVEAADMPQANRFMLHVMAAVAEHESEAISARTKAALAAAKARGVKLGWAIPSRRAEQRRASYKGGLSTARRADRHALNVLPIIKEISAHEELSLRAIAAQLNARGVATDRGGKWYAGTVRAMLKRSLPQDDSAL